MASTNSIPPREPALVRIGGASGAWGDSPRAIGQLLQADVQFLMMDFLSEVTMSLLARARMKDPQAGYPPDAVAYVAPHLKVLATRGVRLVSNGGGMNPRACAAALEAACAKAGVALKVAAIEGDDLLPLAETLRAQGVAEWQSDAPLPQRLATANAYLGARPIAAALDAGADIVITGRVADSALALGILMHAFAWAPTDFDRLAAGSLVGHLLECGPQATGGLFTDWADVPGWDDIGYPIAECSPDGRFVVTKPAGTGGLVDVRTVAEQLLYEVGDPAAYVLPDVVADFTNVRLEPAGDARVRVSGARGRAPTAQYKVSATHVDGARAVALVVIIGEDAVAKAERTAQALVARARRTLAEGGVADFRSVHVEVLGAEASYAPEARAAHARHAREVVLRLVVEHDDAGALEALSRELGSAGLGFAPGTAAMPGGRPKPTPVVRLFSFLIDKARLPPPRVFLNERWFDVPVWPLPEGAAPAAPAPAGGHAPAPEAPQADEVEVALRTIAHARSGDKGDTSNVAVFCRTPAAWPVLRARLTAERLAAHFAAEALGPVTRYEVPGLLALNFVLERALDGGGMASRRIDALGKAFGQRALELRLHVPRALLQGR